MHYHNEATGLPALPLVVVLAATLAISACNRQSDVDESKVADNAATAADTSADITNSDALADSASAATDPPPDTQGTEASLEALIPSSEIPYPVYPNGSKYRVGGEHGLKIVVFETADSFEEVDAFYAAHSAANDMPRLAVRGDYVRYGSDRDDNDAWATDRPGIVVHEFADDNERQAVGAGNGARTNIIMSY